MAQRNLGKMMEGREPASNPSQSFETQQRGRPFFSYGKLTPQRMKRIFSLADNRGRVDLIYRLYTDMENNDLRYAGILNQLRSTIARMPVRVEKAEGRTKKEQQIAEEYKTYAVEALDNLDTHSLVQEMVEPYIRGAMLYKIEWERQDLPFNRSMWFPQNIERVEGRHLIEETGSRSTRGQMKVRTADNPSGIEIDELPFDNHIFLERRQGVGRYSQIGVARKVAPWYLSLRYIKTWWVQFIENYGQPLRIGKYPRVSKKSTRQKAKQFLKKLGKDGYGLFPSGMDIEMIDVNKQGRINVHKEYINLAHQEYSIAILGQAGTTGENNSGYAETVELNGIRRDILENIAEIVSKGLEAGIRKGLRLNYGDNFKSHLVPTARPILLNDRNAQQRAKAVKILSDVGVPVPLGHIYENILGTESPPADHKIIHSGSIKNAPQDLTQLDAAITGENNDSQDRSSDTGDNSVATNPEQDDGTVD